MGYRPTPWGLLRSIVDTLFFPRKYNPKKHQEREERRGYEPGVVGGFGDSSNVEGTKEYWQQKVLEKYEQKELLDEMMIRDFERSLNDNEPEKEIETREEPVEYHGIPIDGSSRELETEEPDKEDDIRDDDTETDDFAQDSDFEHDSGDYGEEGDFV